MRLWRRHVGGRRPRGRGARLLGAVAAGLFAAVIAVGALGHARLRQGPVDLGFLIPMIERAASAQGGVALTLRGVALSMGDADDPGPALRLTGVQVSDAAGRRLFGAPTAAVSVAPLPLLVGRLRPTEVRVLRPAARLTRQPDGRFRLGVGAEGEGDGAAGLLDPEAEADAAAAFEGFDIALAALSGRGEGLLSRLRSVTLTNARMLYVDRDSGRRWRAERADLRVTRGANGALEAVASILLPDGAAGPVAVRAEGVRGRTGEVALRLSFTGASTADLAAQFPALRGAEALDAPVQGRVDARLSPEGRLFALDGRLRAAAGTLRLGDRATGLERAAIDFALDPASRVFDVRRLEARTALGALALSGRVDAPAVDAAADAAAVVEIDIDALTVASGLAAPVGFDDGTALLRVLPEAGRVEVADLQLLRGPLRIRARGALEVAGSEPLGAVVAEAEGLSAAELIALWPPAVAPGARSWLEQNLTAGAVDRADLSAALGPEGPRLGLTFGFRQAVAHYFRPLPPIEGAAGHGVLTLRPGAPAGFALALDAGTVTAPGGGAVDLSGSVLRLPDLEHPETPAEVAARGDGPVAAFLEVLDFEPLGFPGKLGLDPAAVAGTAQAEATLTMPLLRDLLLDQVGVSVSAQLRDVAVTPPGHDLSVTAEALRLVVDTASLRLTGQAAIDGAPMALSWTETFSPAEGAAGTAVALAGALSAAQMAALGLDPRPGLSGVVGVDARLELFRDGAAAFTADLDLARAALDAAPLVWRKAEGTPASARLRGRSGGDGLRLSEISLDAPGLAARGALALDTGGALASLDLDALRLDGLIDAAVRLRREGAGLSGAVDGALLDASAFGGGEDGATGGGMPLSLALNLARLRLDERLTLDQVSGRAWRGADGGIGAALRADAGGPVALRLDGVAGGGATARLESANAGAFLRSTGLFGDGLNGTLELDARLAPGPGLAARGELRIADMSVADDPAILAALSEAEISELPPEGLRFDTIRAPFRFDGASVRLDEAVAYGPTVGVTIGGAYHVETDRLDMAGVFTPAYALNAAVGAIPLLGGLLTGGEGRGLVAFNFSVTGDADDPQVSVNPLSVLTPGVLRRLFEGAPNGPAPPPPERQGAEPWPR